MLFIFGNNIPSVNNANKGPFVIPTAVKANAIIPSNLSTMYTIAVHITPEITTSAFNIRLTVASDGFVNILETKSSYNVPDKQFRCADNVLIIIHEDLKPFLEIREIFIPQSCTKYSSYKETW